MTKEIFYPCQMKTCRFYGQWWKDSNKDNPGFGMGMEGMEKLNNALEMYLLKLSYCLACEHFEKQNNFTLKGKQ